MKNKKSDYEVWEAARMYKIFQKETYKKFNHYKKRAKSERKLKKKCLKIFRISKFGDGNL